MTDRQAALLAAAAYCYGGTFSPADVMSVATKFLDWLGAEKEQARRERVITETGAYYDRLVSWIHRTLTTKGPLTAGELGRRASSKDRAYVKSAISLAVESGLVGRGENGQLIASR